MEAGEEAGEEGGGQDEVDLTRVGSGLLCCELSETVVPSLIAIAAARSLDRASVWGLAATQGDTHDSSRRRLRVDRSPDPMLDMAPRIEDDSLPDIANI